MTTQTTRGRTAMRRPTRAQNPRLVGSGEPNVGLTGQKILRPKISSSAGSKVIIDSSATATPMASTGPRLLVEFSSANDSVSSPRITVPALAMMAGPARRRASAMASCRSSCRRSSSRYRAVSSRA